MLYALKHWKLAFKITFLSFQTGQCNSSLVGSRGKIVGNQAFVKNEVTRAMLLLKQWFIVKSSSSLIKNLENTYAVVRSRTVIMCTLEGSEL